MKQFIVILLFLVPFSVMAEPLARVTLKVVDEKGEPIVGADTEVGFVGVKFGEWKTRPYAKR